MDEIGVVKKSLRYLSEDEREENIWPLNYNSNHNYELWIVNYELIEDCEL